MNGFIHDIRSALGVVQTCLDPETRNSFDVDGPIDLMLMARNQVKNALDLVSQLGTALSLKKEPIETTQITGEEIHTLLDSFVGLYPGVEVSFKAEHDFTVQSDLTLLRRVLDNLITNALHAGKSEKVILLCETDLDVVQIFVKDRGVGMDKRTLDRMGLGFSTTGGGNGTKILLDLLVRTGGTIRWDSIKDVGTCVTVTLRVSK